MVSKGDRFLVRDEHSFYGANYYDEYLLAYVDSNNSLMNLIKLYDGTPWSKPVKVEAPYNITEDEWKQLTDDCVDKFIAIRRK